MGQGEADFRTQKYHPPGAMALGEQGQPPPTPSLGGKEREVGNEQPNLSLPSWDVLLEAAIGGCWNLGTHSGEVSVLSGEQDGSGTGTGMVAYLCLVSSYHQTNSQGPSWMCGPRAMSLGTSLGTRTQCNTLLR